MTDKVISREQAHQEWRQASMQQYAKQYTQLGDGLEVYWWHGVTGFPVISLNDQDEGQNITLAPKHALGLLKWLQQEEEALKKAAQEHGA